MQLITSISGTKAGNVAHTYTNSEGRAKKVLLGHVILTTDATVANRRVIVSLYDADGNELIDVHAGAVVPASQTAQHHELMQGVYREAAYVGNALQVPIPLDCIIPPGGSIAVTIENGVAGDSYTANLLIAKL